MADEMFLCEGCGQVIGFVAGRWVGKTSWVCGRNAPFPTGRGVEHVPGEPVTF